MTFDNQIRTSREQLRKLGIENDAQAIKNLELLSAKLGVEGYDALAPVFFASLSKAADPDMALNNLERFVDSLSDVGLFVSCCRARRDVLWQFVIIFGASRFFSTYLMANADNVLVLFSDPDYINYPVGKAILSQRLAGMIDEGGETKAFFRSLRLFRKQEMLKIGLRDLLEKADLQETITDLSDLAEVSLQAAFERANRELLMRYGKPMVEIPGDMPEAAGFAVIAMGKLGGRELNFSSDVDLMYVYTADGETEGIRSPDGTVSNRITNHQYFIKLAEKINAAIGEKTEDGFVFRVDLRLRPEGQRGPLAQSLGGYEIYYESWGKAWERSALIKARPVAGDERTGREFIERITPFVYRKYLDYGAIAEIRDMKQKINRDVEQKGKTYKDVKLGYGGIREIEFVIQALQLIYGGRDRSLREKPALRALHALSQKGLITYQEQEYLSKAYVFLRTIEHRIQILDDLQTQTMPSDAQSLRSLARRSGYLEAGRETELLLRDYSEHTQRVRRIYDDLFAFTGEETAGGVVAGDFGLLLDPDRTEQEALALFEKYGFLDPGKAYRNLMLLREGPAFVHQTPRSLKLFQEIFPQLFAAIVSSTDPDMALNHLESFLAAQGSWETFQSLINIDASAIKVLVAVFASSEYLSRLLVSRPLYLQNMLESHKFSGVGTIKSYMEGLNEMLGHERGLPEKLDALRRFKHLEEIRIGMADLLSGLKLTAVLHELSKLAEACLGAALRLAAAETGRLYGISISVGGLAVIGVGKLGGRELTYGSDLDVLFVYSNDRAGVPPAGLSTFEYYSKMAEKMIAYLSTITREGFVFRMDARLRPSGTKGPLVQSIEAFKYHYTSQAETWELQTMMRARFVAGDRAVGAAFCSAIQELIYREADRPALARDILAMRRRMEEKLGRQSDSYYNIKQGAGGIVDIEFLVQFFQLLHGRRHRRVRIPGTYDALWALKKEKLLSDEEHSVLRRAYLFLLQLESRMRIISNEATNRLSKNPEELRLLARRMGYADGKLSAGQQLLNDYEIFTKQIRTIFNNVLKE
ncbi:MAG TPA: bifunctional [glutamate--ammonia ligase]-adenylyl-L-tyrosine phosphorylase/[glutamate--ammonia-ligase] adenylyltransferase [Nitrospirota bacterium]|nr:bifunctional [glutamate--ammonia ligase]-adenylyl-L-tyrosine phosphorylase/[glutamate--ammonia-ligase] adenylyltransferase [Nitrospirota bacterium]